jgi:nitroimidazol reductase NimA-like FMN-containing flavoprotein (pyridoxamine 5'-phosphate oxidase superfamily)
VAVISVADDDHGPLVVPIWYSYQPGGEVRIITGRTSRKGKLLDRAGRFSLCVQTETLPYEYVSVEGPIVAVEAADLERDRRPSRTVISAPKWATRTSMARETWSGTCLCACGQNDGSPSTTQSNTSHGECKPANHALHLTAGLACARSAAGECER